MTTSSGNPFVFPGMGLGQNPEHLAGNPLLQSFEMMRTAWNNMGSQMLSGGIPTPPVLNIEELDKRINEMRAVESWLRLNLTMLQGSVQAMEVQRATIATLQSFASMGTGGATMPAAQGAQQPSPLEVALGMKAAPSQPDAHASTPEPAQSTGASERPDEGGGAQAAGTAQAAGASAPHQAWWNMLQNQFNQLASAAAATMTPGASASAPAAGASEDTGSASRTAPAKAARKATKTAARKSAPRKS